MIKFRLNTQLFALQINFLEAYFLLLAGIFFLFCFFDVLFQLLIKALAKPKKLV